MSGWEIIGNRYPFTYTELPDSLVLCRTDLSERVTYIPWRTTTRNTTRTVYGNKRAVCEVCGYGIGDKRWHFCPSCGAEVVE